MIERTEGQQLKEIAIGFVILVIILTYFAFSMGVVTLPEKQPEPIEPIPSPLPTMVVTVLTPEPTPEAIPTLIDDYVDPFASGQRSQGQWFKFFRPEVQGLKNLQVGFIVYRSKILDRYTWYNPSTGNYFSQRPSAGMRYLAVWVNQEEIGDTMGDDTSFWAFDEKAFAIQIGSNLYTTQNNITYSPVIRIKEFDDYTDYSDSVTAPAFGYYVRYTGHNPEAGGYAAEKLGWLRVGRPIDGFLLYEIPKETQIKDIRLLGEFGNFGSAQWMLDTTREYHKIILPSITAMTTQKPLGELE